MSAEILSLSGAPLPGIEANEDIVAALELYLERAKRGEIVALAIAYVAPNDVVNYQHWNGQESFKLAAAVSMLQFHVYSESHQAETFKPFEGDPA